VIVPTHERREALRRALLSLARQTVDSGEYEVIVSVDGSLDGTDEMLASLEVPYELRALRRAQSGRARACNAALAVARGEVTVILDDDMQVVPEFVARHRAHHPPGSKLCVMGAVPIELDSTSSPVVRYLGSKFNEHLRRLAEPGHSFAPRDFYSGNASLRTEVLREVGGYDESFTAYGNEDVDLSLRLQRAGVELAYDPGALAHQEFDKQLPAVLRDNLEKGQTAVALARSHPSVFDQLRLATPWDGSRPWLSLRALLLVVGRRLRWLPEAVFKALLWLERLGAGRQPLFYRAALDYAFWAGADRALRESAGEGSLERLRRELHRGPIDLLLQRQR
jgi:cellulose synthase/poly-beta-1,6-N-acetylglucosamine synthase-like glycosyltransferase